MFHYKLFSFHSEPGQCGNTYQTGTVTNSGSKSLNGTIDARLNENQSLEGGCWDVGIKAWAHSLIWVLIFNHGRYFISLMVPITSKCSLASLIFSLLRSPTQKAEQNPGKELFTSTRQRVDDITARPQALLISVRNWSPPSVHRMYSGIM